MTDEHPDTSNPIDEAITLLQDYHPEIANALIEGPYRAAPDLMDTLGYLIEAADAAIAAPEKVRQYDEAKADANAVIAAATKEADE